MSKPFDQNLYDADDSAKDLLIDYLLDCGVVCYINPDQYGIDILGRYEGTDYAFEVEVKHNWRGFAFPFDSVHYSARKRKFVMPEGKTFFVTFNHERNRFLMVNHNDFMAGKLVNKKTIYTDSEWFVEIPISRAIFRDIPEEG